mmetsp:Transcript_26022/g.47997  ORF Transcript_26022/g.47997 Transcript_26022/m.47997 type:complete len:173 (+) Transcript_26022:118-636(+)
MLKQESPKSNRLSPQRRRRVPKNYAALHGLEIVKQQSPKDLKKPPAGSSLLEMDRFSVVREEAAEGSAVACSSMVAASLLHASSAGLGESKRRHSRLSTPAALHASQSLNDILERRLEVLQQRQHESTVSECIPRLQKRPVPEGLLVLPVSLLGGHKIMPATDVAIPGSKRR